MLVNRACESNKPTQRRTIFIGSEYQDGGQIYGPMWAPGREAGKAWSINSAISLAEATSSVMKRCHSVVLRCRVQ